MAEKYGEVPPKFTKKWWEYFWDYYKWHVIITVVAVLIASVTQCFGASKSYFFQTAVCNVVNIAKQTAQLRTAVFYASGVPKALFNGKIKVILAVSLFAFL